jgi:multiple sugar transport system substrate-binding protein
MADTRDQGPLLRRRGFLKAAAAGVAAPALAGLPGMARGQDVVNLTFWAWTPNTQNQVDLFMQKYPNIKVTLENVGQGAAHYTKVRTALKAGSGIPDVAQMEFQNIRSFRAIDSLLDQAPYGANDYKDQFVEWTWNAVSEGESVYAMPWDSGPMGLLYRNDVYEKAGIAAPAATWAEFAEVAKKYATDNPGMFLTNFGPNDAGWATGLLWQAGWRPFVNNGTEITIRINDDTAKNWAAYWQDLITAKAVDTAPAWNTEWFTAFDTGKYATWIAAAWSPVLLTNVTKASVGHWRAAYMPQWTAGEKITSNWGGSTFGAFKSTQHPAEASLFAAFMATDPVGSRMWNTEQFLFPVLKGLLDDKELMGHKYDFYGGQAVNEVFAEASSNVAQGFEFSPFHDFYASSLNDALGAAVGGNGTLADALDKLQETVVAYATDQGYTVKT